MTGAGLGDNAGPMRGVIRIGAMPSHPIFSGTCAFTHWTERDQCLYDDGLMVAPVIAERGELRAFPLGYPAAFVLIGPLPVLTGRR